MVTREYFLKLQIVRTCILEAVIVCELLVYGRADFYCFHDGNRFSVALSHPFMPAKLISAASSKSDGYDSQVYSCRI